MADCTKNQSVFVWGSCTKGQLGTGTTGAAINVPTRVFDLDGMEI